MPQAAYGTTSPTVGAISVPAAAVPNGVRFVSYNGVRVTVPAAWPVIDLRLHPSTCVRLDQTALYLGSPGPTSDCPAHAVGRADTIWLHTAPAGQQAPSTSQVATVGGVAARVGTDPTSHDKQTQFVTQGVELDATWGADSSPIDQVLASAVTSSGSSTSTPAAASPSTTATAPSSAAVAAPQPASPAAATPAAVTAAITSGAHFGGLAFDTCAAPSVSAMRAWLASPYRAVGVYIGGSMRACGDGNLSASWVAAVHAMGWGLIPTYVGPQAPCVNQSGLATISASQASAQGSANAADAVSQAKHFGMGAGTPIYYDMESYSPSTGCSRTVTTFISAWTSELHHLGYKSGAYGGPGSLMVDMSRSTGSAGFTSPDNVWFADWNGLRSSEDQNSYPGFPNSDWNDHQRAHQYAGNLYRSYGGITEGIDADWVDAAVAGTPPKAATPSAPAAASTNVFSASDFTGSGKANILGITRAGAMYLYRGNGLGGFTAGGTKIGAGWGIFSQ